MDETARGRKKAAGNDDRVRVLTYVLWFEDLLMQASQGFVIDTPTLLVRRGEGKQSVWRAGPAELRVADPHTSRTHCTLEQRGAATVLVDGGSSNGTFLNGERVEKEAPLSDGDLLQIGHTLWSYREVPRSALRALEAAAQAGVNRSFCPEVAELYRVLGLLAPSKEPVLVIAETGSGKELVAQAVHRLSGRTGAFVAVDCGAVPDTLFESTFFGHERGAFTGATEAREGEVIRAHKGTLFLDEVGNLSATSQAKLLRVLESSQVAPLGSRSPVTVDVRWVAATNAQLFDDTSFRSDLVHRLAGFVGRLPPLRRRREDLGILTAQFLGEMGILKASITPAAATAVFHHPFPGNVRQLRASLRSAVLLAKGDASGGGIELDVAHLPELCRPAAAADESPASAEPRKKKTRPPRPAEILAALEASDGNVSEAARALGTYPKQLYRWLDATPELLEKFRKSS